MMNLKGEDMVEVVSICRLQTQKCGCMHSHHMLECSQIDFRSCSILLMIVS